MARVPGRPDNADDVTLRFLLMQKDSGKRFAALSPVFTARWVCRCVAMSSRMPCMRFAVCDPLPENVVSLAEYYRRLSPAACKQLHLLVAEDNATNRQVLRAILERVGHRLTMVENGDAALDLLEQRVDDFDLLVLDKNMPGRSGLEVFRALRFMNPRAGIPTIILSADATSAAMDECREAGVDAYLTKPVESRRLLETIASLARGSTAQDVSIQSASSQSGRGYQSNRGTDIDASVVDDAKLASLRLLDEGDGFFDGLFAGFERDAERSVRDIAQALASSDYPALRDAVHALEGSASDVGAVGLAAAVGRFRTFKPFELESARARDLLEVLRQGLASSLQQIKTTEAAARGDRSQ